MALGKGKESNTEHRTPNTAHVGFFLGRGRGGEWGVAERLRL